MDFFGADDGNHESSIIWDQPCRGQVLDTTSSAVSSSNTHGSLVVRHDAQEQSKSRHQPPEIHFPADANNMIAASKPPASYHSKKPHRTLSLACAGDHGEPLDNQGTQLSPPVKSELYARRQLTNAGLERLVGSKSRGNARDIQDMYTDTGQEGDMGGGPSPPPQQQHQQPQMQQQQLQPTKKQRSCDAGSPSDAVARENGGVLIDQSEVEGSMGFTWAHLQSLQQHMSSICMREDERRVSEYLYSLSQDCPPALAVSGLLDLDESVFGLVTSSHVPQVLSSFFNNPQVLAAIVSTMLGVHFTTEAAGIAHASLENSSSNSSSSSCGSSNNNSAAQRDTSTVPVDADTALRRAALACEILSGRHPVAGECMRQIVDSDELVGTIFAWLRHLKTCENAMATPALTAPKHNSSVSTSLSPIGSALMVGAPTSGLPIETHAQFVSRLLRAMVGAGGHVHAGDAARIKLLQYIHERLSDMVGMFCRVLHLPCMQELLQVLVTCDEEGWGIWVDGGLLEALLDVIGACDNAPSSAPTGMARESYRWQRAELAANTIVGLAELTSGESRGIASLPMDRRFQSQEWLQKLFTVCAKAVPSGNFAPLCILDTLLASEITDPYLDPDEPPPLLALLRSDGARFLAPSSLSRHTLCALHLFRIYFKVSLLHRTHPCGHALADLVFSMTHSALRVLLAPKACCLLLRESSCFLKNVLDTASYQTLTLICVGSGLVDLLCRALVTSHAPAHMVGYKGSSTLSPHHEGVSEIPANRDQASLGINGDAPADWRVESSWSGQRTASACTVAPSRESAIYIKDVLAAIRDRLVDSAAGAGECARTRFKSRVLCAYALCHLFEFFLVRRILKYVCRLYSRVHEENLVSVF